MVVTRIERLHREQLVCVCVCVCLGFHVLLEVVFVVRRTTDVTKETLQYI